MESEAFEVSNDSLLEIYYSLEMQRLFFEDPFQRFEQDLGLVSERCKVEDDSGKLTVKMVKGQDLKMEDVQKHFDKPIAKAAKELRIGLTHFKKRCRQLGIRRWPHRKLRSLNYLIHNLKEFGSEEELSMLEEQRRMVEKQPEMELSDTAKKIRQKAFKANYHKKRNMTVSHP